MTHFSHPEDTYAAVRTLIDRLEGTKHRPFAAKLRLLMTKVCWNSWAELFEALDQTLAEIAVITDPAMDTDIIEMVKAIRQRIAHHIAIYYAHP